MLKFLFTRKKLGPLSDLKSASHWLKELAVRDAYTAQQEITQAIVDFNDGTNFASQQRLKILMQMDEAAQPMQASLCQQYLHNPRMSRIIESRLWNAIELFSIKMMQAYHAFIMDYVANPSTSKLAARMPLITARALHYFSTAAKWHYFRYEPLDRKMWRNLHNLYRFAEFEEFEREKLTLYAHEDYQRETTCADEYLRTLMLNALHPGSLTPKQIEMADRWLQSWSESLSIERGFDSESHVFQIKFDEDRGARRIRQHNEDAMRRYWGTERMSARMTEALAGLRRGDVAAKAKLGEDCRLPACAEFLEYALLQWGPTGPKRAQRAKERTKTMKMIEVVKEFNDLHHLVRQDNQNALRRSDGKAEDTTGLSYDAMLDVRLYGFVTQRTQTRQQSERVPVEPIKYQSERWVAENESEGGYGASIAETQEDWLTLGKVFGVKPERGAHWLLGVVRRLSKLETAQRYVGIEIISHAPFAVQLRVPGTRGVLAIDGIDSVGAYLPTLALYLPKAQSNKSYDSILLPAGDYAISNVWELELQAKVYIIEFKGEREKGDTWIRSSFEVKSKRLASER